VTETEWVETLADEASASGVPGPLACVVYADLRAANVDETLMRHRQYALAGESDRRPGSIPSRFERISRERTYSAIPPGRRAIGHWLSSDSPSTCWFGPPSSRRPRR
jgi:hypothetical protein